MKENNNKKLLFLSSPLCSGKVKVLNEKVQFEIVVLQQLFGIDDQVTQLVSIRLYRIYCLRETGVKPA